MIEYYKRCKHCGIEYLYQASGPYCLYQKCSDTHCDECNTAIKEALSEIPIKEVKIYIKDEVTDITVEELQGYDRKNNPIDLNIVRIGLEGLSYKEIKYKDKELAIISSEEEEVIKERRWIKVEERSEREYRPKGKEVKRIDIIANLELTPIPDETVYFLDFKKKTLKD